MFERFMERARQMVVLAQEEARTLKHSYIGTEHILLGLVGENDGVAARILLDFDADSEEIRNEVIRMLSDHGGRHGAAGPPECASPGLPEPFFETPERAGLGGSSLEDLDELIDQVVDEELEISYRRRIVHAKLDILWAERENRRRRCPDLGR